MKLQLVWGRVPSPVQAERSSAAARAHGNSGSAAMKLKTMPGILRPLLTLALLAFLSALPARAYAQDPSAAQPSQQTSAEPTKETNQAAPEQKTIGGELAEQTRESTGADEEEENSKLKHSSMVQKLAKLTGLNVHQAHLLAIILNFVIIVPLGYWLINKLVFWITGQKSVKDLLRHRSQSIQRALEEARAASQDANRRLADIENRLRQLDVEIGRMQATAEKEADAEEGRVQKAAEEDIRKVVLAAEQEIVVAAKLARRELTTHTAGLAIALARQQINVDSNTDQVLVRTFASKLASHNDDGKDRK
ncbi:MAG TPA: ATP synthase F0 subunit B [Terriglobales bacterium]